MPEIAELLERTLPASSAPDLHTVGRRVRRRRRRRRGVVAGAALTVVAVLGAGIAVRQGDDAESQRVVTRPDLRSLTEPVGSWHQAADPPFGPRTEAATATTDDSRILVWGGRTDRGDGTGGWQTDGGIYDPVTDEWEPIEDAPLGEDVFHATARLSDGLLAVVNGEGSPVTAALYDISEQTWTALPATGIDGIVSAPVWDGTTMAMFRIMPTGGEDQPLTLRWRRGDDTWTTGAPYPHGTREVPAIAATDEAFAVWGGTTSDDLGPNRPVLPGPDPGATADGAVYDLDSDTWQEMAPGPLEPRVNAFADWQGGELVVGAGSNDFDESETPLAPIIARYDPEADAWSQLPFPPDEIVMNDWGGVESPYFFLERTASEAITVVGESGMHSGPAPRWFTLGGTWEEAPLYDLHDVGGALVATSATIDNPDDGPFVVSVRVGPHEWLDGAEAPFTNREEPAIGIAGSTMLVVGGNEGLELDPVDSAWVFTVDG
jgi:hypothetical protein